MIQLIQVYKAYNKNTQIGPLTVDIKKGHMTALIGPNGAGKSTSLKLIGRLNSYQSGSITIDKRSLTDYPSNTLAKKLAILSQDNPIQARITVCQLVSYGRFPYSQGRLTSQDQNLVDHYLAYFDLADYQNHFIDQLSGGLKQRALIAMTLTQETDYILLDEPLNNLDIRSASRIMTYLRQTVDELKRTIIIVLHDINIASQYADQLIMMKEGQIFNAGTTKQLMTSEFLTQLYDIPVEIVDGPKRPLAIY